MGDSNRLSNDKSFINAVYESNKSILGYNTSLDKFYNINKCSRMENENEINSSKSINRPIPLIVSPEVSILNNSNQFVDLESDLKGLTRKLGEDYKISERYIPGSTLVREQQDGNKITIDTQLKDLKTCSEVNFENLNLNQLNDNNKSRYTANWKNN